MSAYPYKINENFLDYEFYSDGPRGKIKKIVRFTPINDKVFNLGFGDLNEYTGVLNDLSVTNNKDSLKTLVTVASTIYDFLKNYPDKYILIRGSTPSRTRLYQMRASIYLKEIGLDFDVYGFKNGNWHVFESSMICEAFLVIRKKTDSFNM